MPIYTRTISPMPDSELRHINTMYALCGITAPDRYSDVRALIVNTPEPRDVVRRYAAEAYETTNPEEFVKEARAAIADATAGEALKRAFLEAERPELQRRLSTIKAEAVDALRPAFNKEVKKLTDAANKLDRDQPLNAEVAIAQDNGQALTDARAALARLGQFASMWQINPGGDVPVALKQLLPILTLPTLVVEQVERTLTENPRTLNPNDTRGTYTVRTLAKDAGADIDTTLIHIAAGRYEGVGFELGSGAVADAAYRRESIEPKRLNFM